MCFVSAVFTYGQHIPEPQWTRENWEQFQRTLDEAKELDEQLGQHDCEDADKGAWMAEVEERLQEEPDGRRTEQH